MKQGGGGWWRCIPKLPGFYVMKQGGLVDVYTTTTWVLCNETGGGGGGGLVEVYTTTTWVLCNETGGGGGGAGGRVYHNYLGFM